MEQACQKTDLPMCSWLEVDPGGELPDSGIVGLSQGDNSPGRTSQACSGAAEIRSVEDIEEFAADFEGS